MRTYSTKIVQLNKISVGGSMDSATVSFKDRTISISSETGMTMQKIIAIQVADI